MFKKILDKRNLLILICLIAFTIHLVGLNFGYPLLVHADEPTIINSVVEITHNKTFDPGHYERPDLILIYINFLFLNIISYLRFGVSIAHSFVGNEFQFYFYSRLIIAVMGSIIPVIAYKIGKQGSVNFALPAAILFAVFPSFVIHSHYVTPDIPVTLFTLLIILFSIYYIKNGNRQNLIIASVVAAVNTAEKYPGVLSLGIIFLSIFIKEIQNKPLVTRYFLIELFKKCLFVTLVFICALYVIAPILFVNYSQVFQAIARESRTRHLGADNLGWLGNILFYAREYAVQTPVILLFFFVIGIFGTLKKKTIYLVPCLFGFFYWIIISKLALHWERWALPMYTFPLLFSAFGVQFIHDSVKSKYLRYLNSVLFIIGCGSLLLNSFSASITMTFTDTRVVALQYCQTNKITPENSIFEAYTPFTPVGGGNFLFDPTLISSQKYVILSSDKFGRYFGEPARYKNEIAIYNKIRQEYKLVKEFSPTTPFPIPFSIPFPSKPQNISYWFDNIIYYFQKILGNQNLPERISGPTIQIFEVTK